MLDLMAVQNSRNKDLKSWDDLSDYEKNAYMISSSLIIIVYITFFFWALMRAAVAPKNKPLHLMFALVSPMFYLVFSYFIDGFYD